MQTIEFIPENELCCYCKKRKATILCDMPKFRVKNLHLKKENGLTDYENSFRWHTVTCDRPLCEKCAIDMGGDIHFCKDCLDKIKRR